MFSMGLRYILNALPVVSYVILLSFSYSFLLYICGRVSLTFAGIYLVGAYATVSLSIALMGNNLSFAGFMGILLLASLLGAAMLVASYLCFERFLKTDVHRMVATSSLLLVFRGLVKVVWGTTPVTYSAPFLELGVSEIAGNIVPNYYLFMLGLALLLMLALAYFLNRTSWGMRFRASSLDGDRTMAQACGVNQNLVTLMTFAISGVLAGLAGGLYAPIAGAAYGSEANALLLAALSVIIGGVGSIGGAVLAAFIVGIVRAVAAIKMPVLELAVPFIIASATLMLRPFGIWGKEFRY
ncbi:MAG: ABC transporter permease subunit [Limnochordia bacterium]|jgi:branched-chain amino acid transport system permease protein